MKYVAVILIWVFVIALLLFAIANISHAEESKKIADAEFIAVSSYLVLMTVFDCETTFSAIRNGAGEANPIMKPFVKNRAYMYGVQLGVDAFIIWLSYEMKGSRDFKNMWWVMPSVVATSHGVAGGLNLRYCW
jgi:hypothetical protein